MLFKAAPSVLLAQLRKQWGLGNPPPLSSCCLLSYPCWGLLQHLAFLSTRRHFWPSSGSAFLNIPSASGPKRCWERDSLCVKSRCHCTGEHTSGFCTPLCRAQLPAEALNHLPDCGVNWQAHPSLCVTCFKGKKSLSERNESSAKCKPKPSTQQGKPRGKIIR